MRWQQAEEWLGQQGFIENVNYTYQESLSIRLVDEAASLANHARMSDPIDQEWVGNYARRIENGSVPPALIVMRMPNGKFLVVDGNHRYLALKKTKAEVFAAYVLAWVDDTAVLRRIVATANASLVGRGASMADLIDHAASVVIEGKKSVVSVAELYNVSEAKLRYEVRNREVAVRLVGMGIDPVSLTPTMRNRLADVPNDAVLAALTKISIQGRLTRKDITDLVSSIRKERSEAGMLLQVQQFRERPDIARRLQQAPLGTRIMRAHGVRRQRLFSGMGNLISLLNTTHSRESLDLTADDDYQKACDMATELTRLLGRTLDIG